MVINVCKICNKQFDSYRKQKYCSVKCNQRNYYLNHKNSCIKRSIEWAEKNPEKIKEIHKKSFKKFIDKDNGKRYNELMRNHYKQNREKWDCRTKTSRLLLNDKIKLDKKCKKCSSTEDLEIHHEIYPLTKEGIIKAVGDNKIYCLCSKHHNKNS